MERFPDSPPVNDLMKWRKPGRFAHLPGPSETPEGGRPAGPLEDQRGAGPNTKPTGTGPTDRPAPAGPSEKG